MIARRRGILPEEVSDRMHRPASFRGGSGNGRGLSVPRPLLRTTPPAKHSGLQELAQPR
jgi:hypothetical protein